jgi:DNA repair exonuclease SbcCD ATPase subunit
MKYINFTSIRIQNFLSVGTEPVEIEFKTGLNIITGLNRDRDDRSNGVGKSTIADALFFALFGKTLRELKKELIVNNITRQTCAVELQFTVSENNAVQNYRVVRQINPTQCTLYHNDEDITLDSIKSTTDRLSKIISATPDIFENCVLMTVNNAIPFMAKKKPEKRKFIESIFDLEMFSCMLTLTRTDYNEKMRELDVECGKYEEISNSLQSHNIQRTVNRSNIDKQIEELQARLKINTSEIKKLSASMDTIPSSSDLDRHIAVNNDLKQKIDEAITLKHKLGESMSVNTALNNQLKKTQSKIGTTDDRCPVCLKGVTEHDKEIIAKEKKDIDDQIKEKEDINHTLVDKQKKVSNAIVKLTDKQSNTRETINNIKSLHEESKNSTLKIDELTVSNSQITGDIKSLKGQYKSLDVIINEIELNLNQKEKEIGKLKDDINILDIVKFVMSEEGVKAYIVNKILQLFNSKIAYYLRKLDSNCICMFNEYFEDQIINEKGQPCSYFNFSGAERKAIDLACLFAFMDIRRLQGNVSYNISLYDELLDSSLDEKGVDLVIGLLLERVEKYNECIVIISHRKESVKIGSHYRNTGEVIFLEKEAGLTRRVEFSESS